MNIMTTSFLEKLIDWKEFELFVADLYKTSDDLTVSHDVTEIGKSGAKRQVDVLVIQKTNFILSRRSLSARGGKIKLIGTLSM